MYESYRPEDTKTGETTELPTQCNVKVLITGLSRRLLCPLYEIFSLFTAWFICFFRRFYITRSVRVSCFNSESCHCSPTWADYANVFFYGTLETDIKFYCSCCHDFAISDLASSIVVLIEHSSSSAPGQLAGTNRNARSTCSRYCRWEEGCF